MRRLPIGSCSIAVLAVISALVAGCGEEQVVLCVAGVCPTGTTCEPSSGRCVPAGQTAKVPVGELGGFVSAALARSGELLVATYDHRFRAAVLERRNGDVVSHERVAGGGAEAGDLGAHVALALDKFDAPRLAFYDATLGALGLASFADGAWSVITADDGAGADVGRWAALVVDGLGFSHLAYRNDTSRRLRLLSLAPHGCRPAGAASDEMIPFEITGQLMADAGMPSADFGRHASLAISGDHRLVFSFYDADRGNLVLGRCDGAEVQLSIIDGEDPATGADLGDVGAWASMTVDESGNVGVAYLDRTRGLLKYAGSSQGELVVSVVDDGGACSDDPYGSGWVGQAAALAVYQDPVGGGLPRIAYLDTTRQQIRLSRRNALKEWSCEVVSTRSDDASYGGIGYGLDLVLSESDAATVAFGTWALRSPGAGAPQFSFGLEIVEVSAP